jgi:hypothetical protein
VVSGSATFAQTNFYTNVTNLWYQGYKTNVLDIANTRLAANSNDIAGLILKAEYNFEFYEVGDISNAYFRVIQVGDTITTTNFVKRWQELSRERILWILDDFAEEPVTPQDVQEGKQKALINEKSLPASLIEALLKDGYFD